jgi:hypothetical protein
LLKPAEKHPATRSCHHSLYLKKNYLVCGSATTGSKSKAIFHLKIDPLSGFFPIAAVQRINSKRLDFQIFFIFGIVAVMMLELVA